MGEEMGYLPIDIDTAATRGDGQTLADLGDHFYDVHSTLLRLNSGCLGGVAATAFENLRSQVWEQDGIVAATFGAVSGGAISTAGTIEEADLGFPVVDDGAGNNGYLSNQDLRSIDNQPWHNRGPAAWPRATQGDGTDYGYASQ